MYEDLQNVLESILEDENEVNKFLEMETMDELYEYFKNKVPNLSVEEFDSFIFDLLEEYAKSAQAVQNLDSSALSKVAGGADVKSRIAAVTMSLLSLIPMAPVGSAQVETGSNIGSARSMKKTDMQGPFDKIKDILLSKFNSAKQTVSNKYKDAKEFVADKYAKTKKWVLEHPELSAGVTIFAVVLLAAATYGIHRYRHSGQQTPSGQLSEPPIPEDNPRLDQEANQELQPAAPQQVDQGPVVRARANSDPQLPHQEIIGRPRSGSDLRRPIGPHLPLRPPAESLPQPQPQPVRAVLEEAPEPQRHTVQFEDLPQAQRGTRGFIGAPAGNTPPAASSGYQIVRSNVPLPTGGEETVMDRLARDALAARLQREQSAVQEAYNASPSGDYGQSKNQPLLLTYTDEWHQQSQQTEQGDVLATNNTRTNVHLQFTNRKVEGPASRLNNRPMGSPTSDSPLLRPSVPHSMPTLDDSAREERSVPQTPVQQTPVQSAQAQLDSAQPTTPARPSPARAAYVSQYTAIRDVGPRIAEAISALEKDRQEREEQHATQEHSTTPQPQRTRMYRHHVHDDLKKSAQVLNNTLLGQNSPVTPAQTPATSTNLEVEPAASPDKTRPLIGRLGGTRPKGQLGRRPPTARHASAPTTPDAAAAVDPQTPAQPAQAPMGNIPRKPKSTFNRKPHSRHKTAEQVTPLEPLVAGDEDKNQNPAAPAQSTTAPKTQDVKEGDITYQSVHPHSHVKNSSSSTSSPPPLPIRPDLSESDPLNSKKFRSPKYSPKYSPK